MYIYVRERENKESVEVYMLNCFLNKLFILLFFCWKIYNVLLFCSGFWRVFSCRIFCLMKFYIEIYYLKYIRVVLIW